MYLHRCELKREQVERLRSEDTRHRLHDYPYYWVILDAKSKEDIAKFKELPKCSRILKQTLQATHLLMLLDKMCKY